MRPNTTVERTFCDNPRKAVHFYVELPVSTVGCDIYWPVAAYGAHVNKESSWRELQMPDLRLGRPHLDFNVVAQPG